MNSIVEDILMHYGMPRRSGRYPYGSGENPYQHTSGKVLSEDLVIHEVPYYQTSNASGGVTSYIAKEGDSK